MHLLKNSSRNGVEFLSKAQLTLTKKPDIFSFPYIKVYNKKRFFAKTYPMDLCDFGTHLFTFHSYSNALLDNGIGIVFLSLQIREKMAAFDARVMKINSLYNFGNIRFVNRISLVNFV